MEVDKNVKPQVVQLRTQLVSQGHTRRLLAQTDLTTLRIHCYAPGIGENARAHERRSYLSRLGWKRAVSRIGWGNRKTHQAPSHRAPQGLLLPVLQLRH